LTSRLLPRAASLSVVAQLLAKAVTATKRSNGCEFYL
jgi:hypothetical protein